MWRHDMISMKDKFRMLMRYIQQMIYGGVVTWFLDSSTCAALNGYAAVNLPVADMMRWSQIGRT